jgi:hypothetical protein
MSVFFEDEFDIDDVNAGEVVDVWPPPNPCMINSPICIELRLVLDVGEDADMNVAEAVPPVKVGTPPRDEPPCVGAIVFVPSTIKACVDAAGSTEMETT